ncbi:hypothetical protein [Xenorhabdus entomophaga]|uniref:hypothetical protein n=1 Tax=Xenorhabdus entomophaga TaxID=3136257 RepID=UPI0030F4699E
MGEASHFTGRCLFLTGLTAASMGRNNEFRCFCKQPILFGDTFDSAIQSLQFWHSHFITAIPSPLRHDHKHLEMAGKMIPCLSLCANQSDNIVG